MLNALKFLVMAIAALVEHVLLPDQRCVRGASDAARAVRRRDKAHPFARRGAEPQQIIAGVES